MSYLQRLKMEGNVQSGFKVFNPDWTCRGFQYEVGQTYEQEQRPSVCDTGFHFCKEAKDCFNYYRFDPNNKVAEVIALGEVAEEVDKCSTNKLQIVREISWEELLTLVNTGNRNSGDCNSGDCNSGNRNSGDCNSGHCNSGNRNSGDCNSGLWNRGHWNTGDRNSGDRNSGDCNSGLCNSGHWNSGDRNSGNWNSGDRNSGHSNSGDRNSGNCNSGDCNSGLCNRGDSNTGDWNSGNCNSGDFNMTDNVSGCFCTEEHKLMFFDKETDMTFREWRSSDAYGILCRIPFEPTRWVWADEMDEEKALEHPEGYLKKICTDKAFLTWWESLNNREMEIIKSIPNFNAEKFFEITGIRV